jgi:hypothetical protein
LGNLFGPSFLCFRYVVAAACSFCAMLGGGVAGRITGSVGF